MVVEVNHSPMFDEIAHTQAGMPHLLQYVWDKYVAFLREEIEKRRGSGQKTIPIMEAIQKAPAVSFLRWGSDFLKEHRVVENFFVDMNHGIRLSNNDCIVVCPGLPVQGTMQDSGAVQVTEGKSQSGQEGVFNPGGSLRI